VREHYLFYGSLIIAALGTIIGFLIFREFHRKQMLRLQQMHEEERLLSEKAVADAEETERRRIAADLHDNLGAQLSFIKRNVDFIMDQPVGFSKDDERKYLSSVNDIAQSAMIDLRETLWVLNKDEVSIQEFADKLKSYLKQQLMGKEMIQCDFKEQIKQNWRLSSGEVMHLFRIVQEVISNIIKHAGAQRINILFNSGQPGEYQLEISDNGKGFDVNNKYNGHYGLENIEQRAKDISAELSITSNPDTGTTIVLMQKGK
jgi:signal transduction histidine kinase